MSGLDRISWLFHSCIMPCISCILQLAVIYRRFSAFTFWCGPGADPKLHHVLRDQHADQQNDQIRH
jgi:hypothetical protein